MLNERYNWLFREVQSNAALVTNRLFNAVDDQRDFEMQHRSVWSVNDRCGFEFQVLLFPNIKVSIGEEHFLSKTGQGCGPIELYKQARIQIDIWLVMSSSFLVDKHHGVFYQIETHCDNKVEGVLYRRYSISDHRPGQQLLGDILQAIWDFGRKETVNDLVERSRLLHNWYYSKQRENKTASS